MDRILVFVAAVVPALAVLFYGVIKTRADWKQAVWKSFLIGAVAAAVCIPIQIGLSWLLTPGASLLGALLTAVLIAAIPQEAAKFFALIGVAERQVDVRRKQDILLLALGVSAGFATLENVFFVAGDTGWRTVAAGGALTAVPGHGINGLIMGALLTGARLQTGRPSLLPVLAVPIVVHAAYDFPLFLLKTDFKLWALELWFAVLLLSAVLAIYLCNHFLRAAGRADAASGRDARRRRAIRSSHNYLIGGAVLIAAAIAAATMLLLTKSNDVAWMGAAVAALPVALGLDLIWDGLRPYRLP